MSCPKPFVANSRAATACLATALICSAILLGGCASSANKAPVAYQQLQSSSMLQSTPKDENGHVPLRYALPDNHLASYAQVLLDPVVIYKGPDAQFGKLSDADQQKLAQYMQSKFSQAIASDHLIVNQPGAGILRIHITLTGADTTTPVISTLRQILPIGAVVGLAKSAADKPSRSMGSVTYSVEAYDSQSNQLLLAFIAKRYPAAENIAASMGSLHAAETGIDKGASALPQELR